MKKLTITLTAILLFGVFTSHAQKILDKIDKTDSKINKAGNTIDRVKNTGDKLIGLFAKKKTDEDETSDTKTIIKISGATISTLNKINEKIENSKNVKSTKLKFSSTGSSITVQHLGNTTNLLTILQKSDSEIFADKNIQGVDDGEIVLKITTKP